MPGSGRAIVWPLALLFLALVWTVVERIPLVLNTETHLDSDLAVDGLTLIEAMRGHWRWHYPGTPHIGTASLAILAPIAALFGPTPFALGVGGVVIAGLVVASTFLLAWRAFGPIVAAWSLIPLAFASSGTIWLSGRITGGHLLAVAWHALAFAGLYASLKQGGRLRAAGLGIWCGLGVWNDSMFLVSLAGLVAAGAVAWFRAGRSRSGLSAGAIWALAFVVGMMPKFVGDRVDTHDAYRETFAPDWRAEVLMGHAKTLGLDCLPRLLVGHRLPGLEAEPGGFTLDGRTKPATGATGLLGILVTTLGLGLFTIAIPGLARDRHNDPGHARWAVRWGLLATSAAVIVGFLLNRNIYNSDNYRYLVFLLVPAAIGFGRVMHGLSLKGHGGALSATMIALGFAGSFTLDLAAWYGQLGWVDESGRPIKRPLDDRVLYFLNIRPKIGHLYGDYWDVYRLSMLTGGRVKGIPSSRYPNRFPEWSTGLRTGHPGVVLVRPTPIGMEMRARAIRDGGEEVFHATGGTLISWP